MALNIRIKIIIKWIYCLVSLLVYPLGNFLDHRDGVAYVIAGSIMCYQSWELLADGLARPFVWRVAAAVPFGIAAGLYNAPIDQLHISTPVILIRVAGVVLAAIIIWTLKFKAIPTARPAK